jgi:hypothetical protein
MNFQDMQANLGFVIAQTTHIEPQVYETRYPDIDYASLIPVDTSAPEWIKSVTYFATNHAGQAEWISGNAKDIPVVGTDRSKFETPVYMAGIGYDYGMEEVNQARMLGIPLEAENARAARRVSEEFIYTAATSGNIEKGYEGIFNYSTVPAVTVAIGVSTNTEWSTKTPAEILLDVNDLVTGVQVATNTVAMADTLLLPFTRFNSIASIQLPNTTMTILEFLRINNVYTAQTGQPLTIRGIRGLDNPTGGSPASARMIAYRRAPEVLKLHLPMSHRFLPVQVQGLQFTVPGIFRFGGVDVRLPNEIRYGDGI